MKETYNVLVIPAGSGMAVSAIKMLRKDKRIKVYSADANKLAPGLYFSHKGYIVPRFDDPNFYPSIEEIIRKDNIDVIFPALDTILLDFSIRKRDFEKIGAKVIISNPEIIKITRDKWRTYTTLKDIVPVPKSFIKKDDIDIDFPLFIKPRMGSGSKFAYKINSERELDFFYDWIEKPIIQEYLEGKEYTVDCVADEDGNLVISIPRERIETKAGISTKGKVIKCDTLHEMAAKISEKLKFYGPFFFQAKEDKEGVPKLTEINPRISGSMSLSSASGPNLHSISVRICMGEKIGLEKTNINYGLYFTRYLEDIYLTEEEIKKKLERIS